MNPNFRSLILERSEVFGANFSPIGDALSINSRNDAQSDNDLARGTGNINPVAGPVQVPDISGQRWTSGTALADVTTIAGHTSGARVAVGVEAESVEDAPEGSPAQYLVTFKNVRTGERFRVFSRAVVAATGLGREVVSLGDAASNALAESEIARADLTRPEERPQILTSALELQYNAASETPRDAYRAARPGQRAPRTFVAGGGDSGRVVLEDVFGTAPADLYNGGGRRDSAQRGEVGDMTWLTGTDGPETCEELIRGVPSRKLQGARGRYSQITSAVRGGRLELQRGRVSSISRISEGANRGRLLVSTTNPQSVSVDVSVVEVAKRIRKLVSGTGKDPQRITSVEVTPRNAARVTFSNPLGGEESLVFGVDVRLDGLELLSEAVRDPRLSATDEERSIEARLRQTPASVSYVGATFRSFENGKATFRLLTGSGSESDVTVDAASELSARGAARYFNLKLPQVGSIYDRVVLGTGYRTETTSVLAPLLGGADLQGKALEDSPEVDVVRDARGNGIAKRLRGRNVFLAGAAAGRNGIVDDARIRSINENRASLFLLQPGSEELGRILASESGVGPRLVVFDEGRGELRAGNSTRRLAVRVPSPTSSRTRTVRDRRGLTPALKSLVADVLDQFQFIGVSEVRIAFSRDNTGALQMSAVGLAESDVTRLAQAFAADPEAYELVDLVTRGGEDESLAFTAQTRGAPNASTSPANQWTIRPASVRVSGM